ncbi:MAG: IS1634 family transposase [Prevotellaceae bacterium]|jgi:transposase|nr:IS1634 family transposase [Prevotellaceae bacterium]
MFIKKIDKSNPKKGKVYFTYRLCESYRIDNKVRHRSILNLGNLGDVPHKYHKLLCDRIEQKLKGENLLFANIPDVVEKNAEYYYRRILGEKLLDTHPVTAITSEKAEYTPDIQKVDVKSIENEDSRTFGCEWIGKQMADRCGLTNFLSHLTDKPRTVQLMLAEIICRMAHPSSEAESSRWMSGESSLCEIFGLLKYPTHKELYAAARQLYAHKSEIETFLFEHFNTKYPSKRQIRLFDLTNFYFEGRKEKSEKAQFGRSKEKRSDAKLISLAMLTDAKGFCCKSKFYAGNISEESTLNEILSEFESTSEQQKGLFDTRPVVVMDAGIATEANLKMLKEKGYDYVCISRSGLKNYVPVDSSEIITIHDNRNNPIEIQKVKSSDEKQTDMFLCVRSSQKQLKQESINKKLTKRFEQYLESINSSLSKKNGVKKEDKVNRRIGRAIEKYPSISKLFDIELQVSEDKTVTSMTWKRNGKSTPDSLYFVRASANELTEDIMWEIYNTVREIESTFRCLKTDLDIRPVFHQKDINSEAHLFIGILAYQLVHAIREELKSKDIHFDWRHIRNIMSSHTLVTTRMKLDNNDSLIIRQPSRANQYAAQIYAALNFKQSNPNMKKKSVVPHK